MTTATEIHPRNEETGTIGSATDAEEFVDEYLQEEYNTTLEAVGEASLAARFLSVLDRIW